MLTSPFTQQQKYNTKLSKPAIIEPVTYCCRALVISKVWFWLAVKTETVPSLWVGLIIRLLFL